MIRFETLHSLPVKPQAGVSLQSTTPTTSSYSASSIREHRCCHWCCRLCWTVWGYAGSASKCYLVDLEWLNMLISTAVIPQSIRINRSAYAWSPTAANNTAQFEMHRTDESCSFRHNSVPTTISGRGRSLPAAARLQFPDSAAPIKSEAAHHANIHSTFPCQPGASSPYRCSYTTQSSQSCCRSRLFR